MRHIFVLFGFISIFSNYTYCSELILSIRCNGVEKTIEDKINEQSRQSHEIDSVRYYYLSDDMLGIMENGQNSFINKKDTNITDRFHSGEWNIGELKIVISKHETSESGKTNSSTRLIVIDRIQGTIRDELSRYDPLIDSSHIVEFNGYCIQSSRMKKF